MSHIVQLLIDGEFVDSSSGKTFETEDPRTGEVLVEVAEAQEEDVDRAVKAARKVCALASACRGCLCGSRSLGCNQTRTWYNSVHPCRTLYND